MGKSLKIMKFWALMCLIRKHLHNFSTALVEKSGKPNILSFLLILLIQAKVKIYQKLDGVNGIDW